MLAWQIGIDHMNLYRILLKIQAVIFRMLFRPESDKQERQYSPPRSESKPSSAGRQEAVMLDQTFRTTTEKSESNIDEHISQGIQSDTGNDSSISAAQNNESHLAITPKIEPSIDSDIPISTTEQAIVDQDEQPDTNEHLLSDNQYNTSHHTKTLESKSDTDRDQSISTTECATIVQSVQADNDKDNLPLTTQNKDETPRSDEETEDLAESASDSVDRNITPEHPDSDPDVEKNKHPENATNANDNVPVKEKVKRNQRTQPTHARGRRGNTNRTSSDGRHTFISIPKMICFEDRRQGWTIAIEFPEDAENLSATFSDGRSLNQKSNGLWIIENLSQNDYILTKWNGKDRNFSLSLPLIFRTSKRWKGRGIRQRGISNGYYIVFASETWQRKRKDWGPLDESRYTGIQIYEFEILKNKNDVNDGFDEADVFLFRNRFQLDGEDFFDDERGTIYMGSPPNIIDQNNWEAVEWIVIGIEGEQGQSEEPTILKPEEMADGYPKIWDDYSGGWFFVRIYDHEGLIHNPDFRFLEALRGICIESSILPSAKGHQNMVIEIIGENIVVESSDPPSSRRIQIDGQKAVINPQPSNKNVILSFCTNDEKIEVEFSNSRVWWKLDTGSAEPSKWRDRPSSISYAHFQAIKMTNAAKLLFRLPGGGVFKSIEAGISPLTDPVSVPVTRKQTQAEIPLRSLGNVQKEALISARFIGAEEGREIAVLWIVSRLPRQANGIVVRRAQGTAHVKIKSRRNKRKYILIRARDEYNLCQKGSWVIVEKLRRHPKAWKVIDQIGRSSSLGNDV